MPEASSAEDLISMFSQRFIRLVMEYLSLVLLFGPLYAVCLQENCCFCLLVQHWLAGDVSLMPDVSVELVSNMMEGIAFATLPCMLLSICILSLLLIL